MLQQESPSDYVIATGVQHSVRNFVNKAAMTLGIRLEWRGHGAEEHGIVDIAPADSAVQIGQRIVAIDPRYFRPAEVDTLLGDASKAREELGWRPSISFDQLVVEMMTADLNLARRDVMVNNAGYRSSKHHE